MAKFVLNKTIRPLNSFYSKNFVGSLSTEVSADLKQPVQYPECFEYTYKGKDKYENILTSRKLKSLPSAEEKLEIMSKKRHIYKVSPSNPNPNSLSLHQQLTNTHRLKLPSSFYETIDDNVMKHFKESFIESNLISRVNPIYIEGEITKPLEQKKEFRITTSILNQIWENSLVRLEKNLDHLKAVKYMPQPRNEAFWYHRDYKPDLIGFKRNATFQFIGNRNSSVFQVTSPYLLKTEEIDFSQLDPAETEVKKSFSDPSAIGVRFYKGQMASTPGFWPNNEVALPFLKVESLSFMQFINSKIFKENCQEDYVTSAALLTAFQWGVALSYNNGFSPFNQLTYPLVIPTIYTDGQTWYFYLYQLNTISFHQHFYDPTTFHPNVCWESGPLKLFENLEELKKGNINEDVIKLWYKFLTRELKDTKGVDLQPYLGVDTRTEEKKQETMNSLKELYARRTTTKYKEIEIPMWRQIYKNKFNKLVAPNPWIRDYDWDHKITVIRKRVPYSKIE